MIAIRGWALVKVLRVRATLSKLVLGFRSFIGFLLNGPRRVWMQAHKWAWLSVLFALGIAVASLNEFCLAVIFFSLSALSGSSRVWHWSEPWLSQFWLNALRVFGTFFMLLGLVAAVAVINVNREDRSWSQLPKAISNMKAWIDGEKAHAKPRGTALSIDLNSEPDFHPIGDTVQGLFWNDSYVYTTVTINNTSDFDLRNVHMSLETDHTFAKIIQLSSIPASLHPGCETPAISSTWSHPGGPDTRQVDGLGVAGIDNSGSSLTNAYDAYLDTFPAHDSVTFLMAATEIDSLHGGTYSNDKHGGVEGKPTEITFARVSGTYSASLSQGNSNLTSYRYDVSKGTRPVGFTLRIIELPNFSLQHLAGRSLWFEMRCPSKPVL
jgi:hypothetical protein